MADLASVDFRRAAAEALLRSRWRTLREAELRLQALRAEVSSLSDRIASGDLDHFALPAADESLDGGHDDE